MNRTIGSVSIFLGDTNREESVCIAVIGGVFIHGTLDEIIDFASEIMEEATKRQEVIAI